MRLIAQMVVRNEEGRYLREVLDHTSQFVDKIVVTDDFSDDNTAQICADHGAEVQQTERNMFVENEGALRSKAWEFLENFAEPGDWILALDADELFYPVKLREWMQTRYSVLGITFYHMWTETHYRVDGAWGPTISSRMFKFIPGGKFKDRTLACGSEPTYVSDFVRRRDFAPHTRFKMKHLGYLLDKDKEVKYERYSLLDGGRFHSKRHIDSIITEPQLAPWRDDL